MKLPPLINRTTLSLAGLGVTSIAGIAAGAAGGDSSTAQDPFAPAEALSREETIPPSPETSNPKPDNGPSQIDSVSRNSPAPAPISVREKAPASDPVRESKPNAPLPKPQSPQRVPSQPQGSKPPAAPAKPKPSAHRPQQPPKPAVHPKAPEDPKNYIYADEKPDLWSGLNDAPIDNGDEYALKTYTCSKVLFKGAPMPDNEKKPMDQEIQGEADSNFVNSRPEED